MSHRGSLRQRLRSSRVSPRAFLRFSARMLVLALMLVLEPLATAADGPGEPPATPPAASARVNLDYQRDAAASTCVSAEQLTADVEARLGRRVFAPAAEAELHARLRARRASGHFVIEIALSDREGHGLGTRRLSTRAPHCSSLDDSVSLVLSLAADMPLAVANGGKPEPAPRPREIIAVPPASLETPLVIPATTHAPRLGLRLEPTLGIGVVGGLMPALGAGLELGLTLRANAFWPVSLRGTGWAEQRRTLASRASGATFSAQTLEVGVCPWTGRFGGLEASVCVLQVLGRVRARGFGFDETWREDAWLVQFGGGAALTQRLGPVFVSASAALLVPAVRRRYFITDGADVSLHEQPWLSPSAAVRVGTEI
jgi:hypothetical protein